jgi:adenosine deaminase
MIAGPAAAALESLRPDQRHFIQTLPKAELHAHLNGCIPLAVLQDLAREYTASDTPGSLSSEQIQTGLTELLNGPLNQISDFFSLFPTIYALTTTPPSLARATRAVLSSFLDGAIPQCRYLELRTTPKETNEMTREQYLRIVLREVAQYGKDKAALIVSLDRKMGEDVLQECVGIAKKLKAEGELVVGIDLCGDPTAGDVEVFRRYFEDASAAGLGVTLHVAEVCVFTMIKSFSDNITYADRPSTILLKRPSSFYLFHITD